MTNTTHVRKLAAEGFKRMQSDPEAFFRDWLGIDPWQKQVEIAESVRDNRRTAVKSCHSPGKSFITARIIIWFLHAYPGSVVITTAPSANQVENILWREVRSAYETSKKPLLGRCLTTRIDISADWYALGFKAADTEGSRFQGFHADHILVCVDEAAGVAETVYEAIEATMTSENARMLLIGNPTETSGTFYEAFNSQRHIWNTITISAYDTPNLIAGEVIRPYLVTPQWVEDAISRYGKDSAFVQSRVFAEFPKEGTDALIPLGWVEAAVARWRDRMAAGGAPLDELTHVGVDVAAGGEDKTVLALRHGDVITELQEYTDRSTMITAGHVYRAIQNTNARAVIDVIGYGSGVYWKLYEDLEGEALERVVAFNAAESSDEKDVSGKLGMFNQRSAAWWNMRELLNPENGHEIALPPHDLLIGDLTAPKWSVVGRGNIRVESKDDIKKRLGRSTDHGDAVVMAFANVGPKPRARIRASSVGRRKARARGRRR